MKEEKKNKRRLLQGKSVGLIVVILAAVLLELISAIQYYYTRGILERKLEEQVLSQLMGSSLRMDGIMNGAESITCNQAWHVERHLDDPAYMEMVVSNLVKSQGDIIVGACIAFKPNYYASKGYWYEPYARQSGDTVIVSQIGSASHDYTTHDFFKQCIQGDTMRWNSPYLDPDGAQSIVTTFAIPICNKKGEPVAALGADVTTKWVGETVSRIRTYPSSFGMVLSGEGDLIAVDDSLCTPKLAHQLVLMINDSTVKREEKANGRVRGFDFYDEDQHRKGHLYYAMKRKEPKWQMVLVCYDDEAFGELERMRKNILWMSLAGLLVLGLIIHLFARNIRRLHKSQIEQEHFDGELKIAGDIQAEMLPRENRIVRNDINLHGTLIPAREVGGDLYDFFIRDEKLFFCIGDVSGKGVASAMLMAVTLTLFRSASANESNPARIMQAINTSCCRGNDSNMFVTLFVGVLDLPSGHLRYCDAGHDNPCFIDNGELKLVDCNPHLPLGLFDDIKYTVQEMKLSPDSTIFLYTDGLTEARNAEHKLFGLNRVEEVLGGCAQLMPEKVLETMRKAARQFVGDAVQSDDLTMLAIRYTPKFVSTLTETLTIKNNVSEVVRFSNFMKNVTDKLGIETSLARQLRLAVEEAVVNVIDYAYPAGTEGDITVKLMSDGQSLRFQIVDSGVPFDPTAKEKTDTTLSAEDRQIGGLGILLLRELMDSINYEREGGQNVLTLIKDIKNNTK